MGLFINLDFQSGLELYCEVISPVKIYAKICIELHATGTTN